MLRRLVLKITALAAIRQALRIEFLLLNGNAKEGECFRDRPLLVL
jgi:hypothetical protein